QITDRLRRVVVGLKRIECLGFRAQAEAQLTTCLGLSENTGRQGHEQNTRTLHERTSCLLRITWKELIMSISTTIGTKRQGSGRNVMASCISRSRLPSDGSGSVTPNPRAPRLASAITNTGIEIQNCARRVPRRLGSRCKRISFSPEKPAARAFQTKS